MTTLPDDTIAKRNVAVLILAQAIMGAQMPMIFILAGLAGQSLASNVCFATLPISLIVVGSMCSSPILANIMQRHGRKTGFIIGAMGGALGAFIGSIGLYMNSFPIFLLGSLFTGIYMSAQAFFRFAAVDAASETFRPKAISYVLAGGLLAAVIGPQLVKATAGAIAIPYLATYIAVIGLNLGGSLIFLLFKATDPTIGPQAQQKGRSRREILKDPKIVVAMICAMVSYSLMNLVMTSTPLAVVGCGYSKNMAADIVSAHVLAMFIPSFFTGHLIARFGPQRIIFSGLLLLLMSCVAGLSGVTSSHFFASLILLGLGWNFGFVGATTMLAQSHSPAERGTVQGMNDLMLFGSVTLASFASGGLMNCSGSSAESGWTFVNFAMLPLLALAALALLWFMRSEKAQTPQAA